MCLDMKNSFHHWVWFPWVHSLGCVPYPFSNEDCLPFMPKKKETQQKSFVGSFVIGPNSRYYQQLVKSVGLVF